MASKKRKYKPQGHYCKVCDTYKANEKFSGKGHAAHICMVCMKLPPAERSAQMTLNKIEGMAFRYLNESEIKWLRGKMNDQRPEVREAALEAHRIKFPHYERNLMKKGLTAHSLEFFIHGEIWDEWGDEISVHMRFFVDNSGLFQRIDYDAPERERETEIRMDGQDARKLLKAIVHELNAPFWDEDLSDAGPSDDPYLDVLPEYRDCDSDMIDNGFEEEAEYADEGDKAENRQPPWSLRLKLNKGDEREIIFYNQMHDEPQELFHLLNDCFVQDEEYDENEVDGDI